MPSADAASAPALRGALVRDFAATTQLPPEFQWLRTPYPERLFCFTGRALRLHGRESVGSWFEQALVARRQEDHHFRAETTLEFTPGHYQQLAGLTLYYNRYKFHLVGVTADHAGQRVLTILSCAGDYPDGRLDFPLDVAPGLAASGAVHLAAEVHGAALQFSPTAAAAGSLWARCSMPA